MKKNFNFGSAAALYKEILKYYPAYIDAYFRLGCIERDRGKVCRAAELFKNTISINSKCTTGWILLANLHVSTEEWDQAQSKYEQIMQNDSDTYSVLSLANIYCAKARNEDNIKLLDKAYYMYLSVLKKDYNNIYAAVGLAMVLARKNLLSQAEHILLKVTTCKYDCADAWINLAHICLLQGHFQNAITYYKHIITKLCINQSKLMVCLARAYYECDRLFECKQVLLKALHISPSDVLVLYNLALVQKELIQRTLEKVRPKLNINAIKQDLRYIYELFKYINLSKVKQDIYDTSKLLENLNQCESLLNKMNI